VSKQSKIPALVLNMPGAPHGWHMVEGLHGLVHPTIPVVHIGGEGFVKAFDAQAKEAAKAWDAHEADQEKKDLRRNGRVPFVKPECPVKVVQVTEAEAVAGAEAHAEARKAAEPRLRAARRSDDVEKTLAHNEAAALAGGEE
jgi:hypothetical protein